MDTNQLIGEIANRIKAYHTNTELETYLKGESIPESEIAGVIGRAHALLLQEKVDYFGKRNKRIYYAWLGAAVLTLLLFLFVIPYLQVTGFITFLAIAGTLLLCLFCYMALGYNKSWEPAEIEKQETPNISFNAFFLFLIPGTIVYFIFSWRLNSGQQALLKKSMVKTTGTILTGKSTTLKNLRGRSVDFSEVTVSFETKDGANVVATEDVTSYAFKNFYVGQQLDIVYSQDNPGNIDLLIDGDNVRDLTGSEEREITVQDLLLLSAVPKDSLLMGLNKIKYGWQYNPQAAGYINEKNRSALMVTNGQLLYMSAGTAMLTFPKQFLALGFKQTSPQQQGPMAMLGKKTFENVSYEASLSMVNSNGTQQTITTVRKK